MRSSSRRPGARRRRTIRRSRKKRRRLSLSRRRNLPRSLDLLSRKDSKGGRRSINRRIQARRIVDS